MYAMIRDYHSNLEFKKKLDNPKKTSKTSSHHHHHQEHASSSTSTPLLDSDTN